MNKYGSLYKTAEFLGKIIPKKEINSLIHSSIQFLKHLDSYQINNPFITLSVHVGDGIWFYYKGQPLFFIKPTQKHILFHIFENNMLSESILKQKGLFQNEWETDYSYKVWKIGESELNWLMRHIPEMCPMPIEGYSEGKDGHARYIPGDVRQAVLEDFISNGRYCNGVKGRTKKHKTNKGDMIEFDHILPYSEGGPNSYYNVQILCKKCNRIKRATAK